MKNFYFAVGFGNYSYRCKEYSFSVSELTKQCFDGVINCVLQDHGRTELVVKKRNLLEDTKHNLASAMLVEWKSIKHKKFNSGEVYRGILHSLYTQELLDEGLLIYDGEYFLVGKHITLIELDVEFKDMIFAFIAKSLGLSIYEIWWFTILIFIFPYNALA